MMVMFVFFSDFEAVCVEVLPLGMGLIYFLGCWLVPVITDFSYWLLLKYERAPDPSGGRGEDGHVASSWCASLLPALRLRPERRPRCVQFPTVQREVFEV